MAFNKIKLSEAELDDVIGGAYGLEDQHSYRFRPDKTIDLTPQEEIDALNPQQKSINFPS